MIQVQANPFDFMSAAISRRIRFLMFLAAPFAVSGLAGAAGESAGFALIGTAALPPAQSVFEVPPPRLGDILVRPHGGSTTFATPTATPVVPNGDLCVDAIPINCGGSHSGTTTGKTFEAAPSCAKAGVVNAPGAWYRHIGTNQMVTASLCGSSYDTKLSVYTGLCGSLICLDGFDDFCMLASEVTWFAAAGVEYRILVHGYSGATGDYTLNVTCPVSPTPTSAPCCPGDANNSGSFVDANDFIAVQANFGADNGIGGLGDANCSGSFVDANDFIAVQANFGADCG